MNHPSFATAPEGCVLIPLTQGQFALIDKEDEPLISQHRWYAQRTPTGTFYALRMQLQKPVRMHRIILGLDDPNLCADHISGNGLDNRRCNLRVATKAQNSANRYQRIGQSGYRGVNVDNRRSKPRYRGQMARFWSGPYHATPEEAARDYDAQALLRWGEFARLNFPHEHRDMTDVAS